MFTSGFKTYMCTVYFLWIYPDYIIIYQRSLIIKIRKVILLVRIKKWRVFCKESVTRNDFQLRSQTEHVLYLYSYTQILKTLWYLQLIHMATLQLLYELKKTQGTKLSISHFLVYEGQIHPPTTTVYPIFYSHWKYYRKRYREVSSFSFLLFQWLSLWHETQTFQAFSSSCHWLLCHRRKVTHIIYKIMVIQPVDIKILYNTVITHFFSVDDENCISNICRVGLLFVQ